MKKIITSLIAILFLSNIIVAVGQQGSPFVVIELYTSQGCSSCPNADKFLVQLMDEYFEGKPVIAIAQHVTYWNYLGWEDVFSQKIFDDRQRTYCQKLSSQVYTPMFVLNGQKISLNGNEIYDYMNKSIAQQTEKSVEIFPAEISEGEIAVSYKTSNAADGDLLNIVLVESGLETKINSGENKGKTLEYNYVARVFKTIALAGKAEGQISIDIPEYVNRKKASVYAFIQNGATLEIKAGDTGFNLFDISVGTDDGATDAADLKAWPNPASGEIFFESGDFNGPLTVKAYDITGRLLREYSGIFSGSVTLSLSGIREKNIFVRITGQGGKEYYTGSFQINK